MFVKALQEASPLSGEDDVCVVRARANDSVGVLSHIRAELASVTTGEEVFDFFHTIPQRFRRNHSVESSPMNASIVGQRSQRVSVSTISSSN